MGPIPGGSRKELDPEDIEPALGDPRTLAAVLRSANDGIVLFDPEGTIADWNPAAERILGYPRDLAVGRDLIALTVPDRLRGRMRSMIAGRGSGWGEAARQQLELSLLDARGKEVPLEVSLSWAQGSGLFAAHLRQLDERERRLTTISRRRERLIDLGARILSPAPVDGLLAMALQAAADELDLARVEVWERGERGELRLRCAHGAGIASGARVSPDPDSPLAAALAQASSPILVGDAGAPSPWQPAGREADASRGVASVLRASEGTVGVLSGSIGTGGSLSDSDLEFLASLSMLLASALDRERRDRSRAIAEIRHRDLVERLPAITYRAGLGESGRWLYISPQVEELLGVSPEECLADHFWWEKLMHPDDLDRVLAEEDRISGTDQELDVRYRMRARDGRALWVRDRCSISRRSDDGNEIVEGLIVDITAQQQAEDRLRHLADHDPLTELLNRRGFESAVDRMLASGGPGLRGALAILNVDHLKRLNDSLGHAAGDALLRDLAEAITGPIGPDAVIGRLGGDEFGLFLPGIGHQAAGRRFGEILDLIRESGTGGPQVTGSIGATIFEDAGGLTASGLMAGADLAVYQAKQRGRDRVAFSDVAGEEGIGWVNEVREVIETGRLELHGQPIFDLRTGRHHADELLVRMVNRDGAIVAAKDFVPVAERYGMIRQLDRWVVARAVERAAEGRRVSVNLSAASISDTGLTDLVADGLTERGALDPGLITFEITETVATPPLGALRAFSERVERLGCGLSLDDVGTGFGTLTYLQNLRFSQLKIDMGFVQGILDSATDAGIVRALVVIGRELGLETVAEGIESAEVLSALESLGVDRVQGYYLGRPQRLEPLR